ncbi:MAG: SprT family zinc-dependent metalloprotease [Bacteroidales bacterium]|nr:SprT family zinc-dependent metalloprotease [Bacteroidales bacterium]
MGNSSFSDVDFGTITIKINPKARSVIFRLTPNELKITVPAHCTQKEFQRILENHRPTLKLKQTKAKPATIFDENTELQTNRFRVKILRTDRADFYFSRKEGVLYIACPMQTDFNRASVREMIIKGIERYLRSDAKMHLPERLKMLADQKGLKFSEVKINSSKTRWGSCSGRKSINLSFYLMLLPSHLIDYVLLHELTHTLEMNHSPRFWAKLDEFAQNKSDKFKKELKSYRTSL